MYSEFKIRLTIRQLLGFWIKWLLLTFFGWHFLTWDLCCQHNIIKLWILVELSGFQATRISTSLVQRLPNSQLPKGASFKKTNTYFRVGTWRLEPKVPITFSNRKFRFLIEQKKSLFSYLLNILWFFSHRHEMVVIKNQFIIFEWKLTAIKKFRWVHQIIFIK